MSYLFVFLLLVISQPSLSNTDGSLEPSYSSIDFEVWLVGALAFLAAVILLTFNWILFFSAIYKSNKEYRKFEQVSSFSPLQVVFGYTAPSPSPNLNLALTLI